MRFFIGVVILFAASFAGVMYFGSPAKTSTPPDVMAILETQPEAYKRIYQAFRIIGSDEIEALDRSLIAFDKHANEQILRRDIGGPMIRTISSEGRRMQQTGLVRLETITRRNLGLIRRYQQFGEAFCDATIQGDYGSADKYLHKDLLTKEADALIEEFKQARFELAVLALEAIARGETDPIAVPQVDEDRIAEALARVASPEEARILDSLGKYDKSCREGEAVMETAMRIPDRDIRHALLAVLSGNDS